MSEAQAKSGKNPFAQPESIYRLNFRVPMQWVLAVEELFDGEALSTASFEDPREPDYWTVEILLSQAPEEKELQARLRTLEERTGFAAALPQAVRVEQRDWQGSLIRDFPPLSIGRFFVHGAHARAHKPAHAQAIQIEAGMAFGSGEHATTSGCLMAIDALARKRQFARVLDMGCGSAILAIAAARCWPRARVLAVDIDPVSVRVACENLAINHARSQVRAIAGDGYADARVKHAAPFDLILANILARPLVKFAPRLAANLAPGGVAVLSGLLVTQSAYVLAAHRRAGLRLTQRIAKDGWCTLLLEK